MVRRLGLSLLLLGLPVAAALGQPSFPRHDLQGPGWGCGKAFGINLRAGERLSWIEGGMDFVTYRFAHDSRETVIYEGNAPQPGGTVLRTGRNWPNVVVVHDDATAARRLTLDKRAMARCPAKAAGQ